MNGSIFHLSPPFTLIHLEFFCMILQNRRTNPSSFVWGGGKNCFIHCRREHITLKAPRRDVQTASVWICLKAHQMSSFSRSSTLLYIDLFLSVISAHAPRPPAGEGVTGASDLRSWQWAPGAVSHAASLLAWEAAPCSSVHDGALWGGCKNTGAVRAAGLSESLQRTL